MSDVIFVDQHLFRCVSQDFSVYEVTDSSAGWSVFKPRIDSLGMNLKIHRVGRVFQWDSLVVIGGKITVSVGDRTTSVVLRSTDHGSSYSVIGLGLDSLAVSDGISGTSGLHQFFLDMRGRRWSSTDGALTWKMTPMQGCVEIDMLNQEMGVSIDIDRKTQFTVNNWQKTIDAIPSARRITRKQPPLNKDVFWDRDLCFWDSHLILRVGNELYRTQTNDLYWARWDSISVFALSRDRKTLVYQDFSGSVYECSSFTSPPTRIAVGQLQAQFIRVHKGIVILVRADTGPVVLHRGVRIIMRPLMQEQTITRVDIRDESVGSPRWGILQDGTSSAVFDVVRLEGKQWKRDTTLFIGPVSRMEEGQGDSLIIHAGGHTYVYHKRTKVLSRLILERPLSAFNTSPVFRFRTRITSKSPDGSLVTTWAEYRRNASMFTCTEMVDSSSNGIRSKLVSLRIPVDTVSELLSKVSHRSNAPLDVALAACSTPVDEIRSAVLDSLFRYDEFFNDSLGYESPPEKHEQIKDCKQFFDEVARNVSAMSSEQIESAILAWRWTQDSIAISYSLTFENQSGKQIKLESAAAYGSHSPGMIRWRVTTDSRSWLTYSDEIPRFYLTTLTTEVPDQRFRELCHPVWLQIAVAAYDDGRRNARWHTWSTTHRTALLEH